MEWYDSSKHKTFEKVPDFNEVPTNDVLGLFEAVEQRRRERKVKLAHFKYIEEKMQKCYMYEGVNNFNHNCRHLIHEFQQTRDELMGWKKDKRINDHIPNAHVHLDPPVYMETQQQQQHSN